MNGFANPRPPMEFQSSEDGPHLRFTGPPPTIGMPTSTEPPSFSLVLPA